MARRGLRDPALIDALEAMSPEPLDGPLWRVTREDRDPCVGVRSGGRWDDESFDVLYTCEDRDGAIAEMRYHLGKGQPVVPSKPRYHLHELRVELSAALTLTDSAVLERLGIDVSRFGRLTYVNREQEYTRTQIVGEIAFFLDLEAVRVPNARYPGSTNAVLFTERVDPDRLEHVQDHGLVNFAETT